MHVRDAQGPLSILVGRLWYWRRDERQILNRGRSRARADQDRHDRPLYTLDDVRAFYEARRQAHEQLGLPKNDHLTLNDVRELKILPQDTLAAFYEMLADADYHSRRLAFVVAPTLVRAQVVRALDGRKNARWFEDPVEAEAWLIEEEPQALPLRKASRG